MPKDTSWEKSSHWYNKHMKEDGGYNHKKLVLPNLLSLLCLKDGDTLLDLGSGQGFLSRSIPSNINYLGLDASKSLVDFARGKNMNPLHQFKVHDATKPLNEKKKFSHAVFVLSLQNIANADLAIEVASNALEEGGQLVIVLNHPCFRIPKYSSWGFMENHKGQYRRVDRYLSIFKSTLLTHPSKGEKSPKTYSFHRPISFYVQVLKHAGLYVDNMLEVCSDRNSYGKAAKAENFARKEFPLFMMISARKKKSL